MTGKLNKEITTFLRDDLRNQQKSPPPDFEYHDMVKKMAGWFC